MENLEQQRIYIASEPYIGLGVTTFDIIEEEERIGYFNELEGIVMNGEFAPDEVTDILISFLGLVCFDEILENLNLDFFEAYHCLHLGYWIEEKQQYIHDFIQKWLDIDRREFHHMLDLTYTTEGFEDEEYYSNGKLKSFSVMNEVESYDLNFPIDYKGEYHFLQLFIEESKYDELLFDLHELIR